jgi:hypothetical protein
MKFVEMILMIYNNITMITNNTTYFYWRIIQSISYLTYFILLLYIIGYVKDTEQYIKELSNISQIIVSLFIMWKFNIFRTNVSFSIFDQYIIFQCGLFLFLTTSLNQIIINYLTQIKNNI